MPHKNAHGIDVSAEEERFLRRAFRRFALPYVLAFAALAWIASTLAGSDSAGVPAETVDGLAEQVEALEAATERLGERLDALGADVAKAGSRVAALEKKGAAASTARPDPGLERRIRDAAQRVERMERRIADEAAGERIDALATRMTRIEREMQRSVPAAQAPAPPPPPSAAPTR